MQAPTPTTAQQLLSAWQADTEVAAEFNVTTSQLRAMTRRGEFPAPLKFGRALRYSRAAIQQWLEAQAATVGA